MEPVFGLFNSPPGNVKARFPVSSALFANRPIPECPKIKAHLCFFNEQVDAILVDGTEVPRPLTKWSRDWKEKAALIFDAAGPVIRP